MWRIVATAVILLGLAHAELPSGGTPNSIYDAASYTSKLRSVTNGVLYNVTGVPNRTHLLVMHVYGSAYERGVAHGSLLSKELPAFFLKVRHFVANVKCRHADPDLHRRSSQSSLRCLDRPAETV